MTNSSHSVRYGVATLIVSLCCPAIITPPVGAESPADWSEFRGPDARGVAAGALPSTWGESDYVWKRSLGSRDVGSPVVHGGNVYYLVSKPGQGKLAVESIRLSDGKLRWSKEYDQQNHHLHNRNTFASSTPTADDQNVFVAFADSDHTYLKCLDHDGKEVWSRDFGAWQSQHGFGTSPKIHGDTVLLFNSQQAEQLRPGQAAAESHMIAVDRSTGQTRWASKLAATRSCYGVPAIFEAADGATQILDANTGNGFFAIDASDGKMLWNKEVFDKRCCATPLIVGDIAIASCGSGGGGNRLVAVRIPSRPGAEPEVLYEIDRHAPYVPTPVSIANRLFMVSDAGVASCVDVETGEAIWTERIGGKFGASPIAIGDTLLLISLDGEATLLKASDQFQKLGRVDLGGPVGATPAYSDGRLLLRVGEELRCLGGLAI